MDTNKKTASGAANTTDSKSNESTASVTQLKDSVNPAGQRTAIRRAYHAAEKLAREKNDPSILAKRINTLVQQFAPYGFSREQIVSIGNGSFGSDNDPDFSKPATKPPMMERQTPTEWTSSETQQLRVMKEKGVANSEICKQLHKTAQQVSSKWYTLRKAVGKIKGSAPVLDKPPEPAPAPVPIPASEPEKPVPEFDLTKLDKPIAEHFDIFSTLQEIMRQANAGYASVSITRQDGTKYRAEVRKDANSKNQVEHR